MLFLQTISIAFIRLIDRLMYTCQTYYQPSSITIAYDAHGILGGVSTSAQGGKFWQGFASGAVSSFVSSATAGICGLCKVPEGWTKAAMVAAGGLSGGVTASMAGGSFWDGVCNGLICSGLNHALHMITDYYNKKGQLLYHTNDGLNTKIIVDDNNFDRLKSELQKALRDGLLDDPEYNKDLQKLGQEVYEYSIAPFAGMDDNWISGYKSTYDAAYGGSNRHHFIKKFFLSFGVGERDDGSFSESIIGGMDNGRLDGIYDRKNGYINRINPYPYLQNNYPIINLNRYHRMTHFYSRP